MLIRFGNVQDIVPAASSMASVSSWASEATPEYTVSSNNAFDQITANDSHSRDSMQASIPSEGNKYIIRHRRTGKAIAINSHGNNWLVFFNSVAMSEGCYWECEENDKGWYGFKHKGRYLGRDG